MERDIYKAPKNVGFNITDRFQSTDIPDSLSLTKDQCQTMVHPCVINGKQTLVYEKGLAQKKPDIYQRLVNFAERSNYILLEDRRNDFVAGVKRVKNHRHANVITLMVLTASLLSHNADANRIEQDDTGFLPTAIQSQMSEMFELGTYSSEEELLPNLLSWINQHSSFSYDLQDLPKVNKVSATDIAKVAFGGELPKAVDADSLQIYGLYNFNEEAIYLLDSLDLATEQGKAILLHELVHFLQYKMGEDKNVDCKNELESLAYLLEAKYLHSHGEQHPMNQAQIDRISECR